MCGVTLMTWSCGWLYIAYWVLLIKGLNSSCRALALVKDKALWLINKILGLWRIANFLNDYLILIRLFCILLRLLLDINSKWCYEFIGVIYGFWESNNSSSCAFTTSIIKVNSSFDIGTWLFGVRCTALSYCIFNFKVIFSLSYGSKRFSFIKEFIFLNYLGVSLLWVILLR